jgi:hypothetical protein
MHHSSWRTGNRCSLICKPRTGRVEFPIIGMGSTGAVRGRPGFVVQIRARALRNNAWGTS